MINANIGDIRQASKYLLDEIGFRPEIGIALGSGWGGLLVDVKDAKYIDYAKTPHMKRSTVQGHAGKWVFGEVAGKKIVAMSGRLHFYEGYSLQDVTFPIRVMKEMGVQKLILTNASGAVNTSFNPGDLMLITDHINMTCANPLVGANCDEMGERFPDMTRVYSRELLDIARKVSDEMNFPVKEGVYMWLLGPSYETPAEIRMARILGADAVGMSTVPEAIVAKQMKMKILGMSCATNMAAGILDQPLSHKEVLDTARRIESDYRKYLYNVIKAI
ncbi:MAG: purine-nucleoside phosphorylase [Clostridia bacterium]|nr:purine-nucleoside phosphorylase [Clostridia bacterium]